MIINYVMDLAMMVVCTFDFNIYGDSRLIEILSIINDVDCSKRNVEIINLC